MGAFWPFRGDCNVENIAIDIMIVLIFQVDYFQNYTAEMDMGAHDQSTFHRKSFLAFWGVTALRPLSGLSVRVCFPSYQIPEGRSVPIRST